MIVEMDLEPIPDQSGFRGTGLPESVSRCLAYLHDSSTNLGAGGLSFERLSALAGVPSKQLSRDFRSALGLRPMEVLLMARLDRSLVLLEGTTLPIAEVAAASGFRGAPHYFKVFWFAFSLAPLDYREAVARGQRPSMRSSALQGLRAQQVLSGLRLTVPG
jgi:AraC family transcriptional regulator of adaptative response / DNA-3-methyladenine glycosylase II